MNNLLSLQKIFNETIFRIPDYQRGYSWSNQQLQEFWSDLTSLLPNQNHYTGMISLKELNREDILQSKEKWNDEQWLVKNGHVLYEVVDGQQRLTTLIILINEIVSYCNKHNINEINDTKIENIIEKYLYKDKSGNIIRTYKFGYEEDNPSYKYFRYVILEEENSGTIEETFYTLNLFNAKCFFKTRVENYIAEYGFEKFEELYRKITQQLQFNLYFIKDDFNVFVAFETMNNRGKRLSYLELLKNRLIYLSTLFDKPEDEKRKVREEINDAWREIYGYLGKNKNHPLSDDEFLQNHWMIYFGYNTRKVSGNQTIPYYIYLLNVHFIQQNINLAYKYDLDLTGLDVDVDEQDDIGQEVDCESNNQGTLSLESIRNYVRSLKELIQYWYYMYFPTGKFSPELNKYLFRLNELGHVNARPLITVLLSKKDISEEDKIKCLKYIERFNLLHYRLNGYYGTYDNSVFYNLARDLYWGEKNINDVFAVVSKIEYMDDNNIIRSAGIIEKFRKLFRRDGFYSWGTLKFLLYVYDINETLTPSEQKLNPNEYFKQDPKDSYSIEHIYPQKAVDEYWEKRFGMYTESERKLLSSSLGNMLPLSQRINSKLQNHSFDKKKERYVLGSRSEQDVAKNDEWIPELILERGLKILAFMEKEWDFKFPNEEDKVKLLALDFLK